MCHLKLHLPLGDKQTAVDQKGHGWLKHERQGYIPPKLTRYIEVLKETCQTAEISLSIILESQRDLDLLCRAQS